MRRFIGSSSLALLALAALGVSARAAERGLSKENMTFGTLTPPSEVSVRVQAAAWLKAHGRSQDRAAFDAVWAQKDKPVLDRLAETFALGDPQAAALLRQARDPNAPAPTALPQVLGDARRPALYRANL